MTRGLPNVSGLSLSIPIHLLPIFGWQLVLMYAGRHEEAIRHAEQALRLDPFHRVGYCETCVVGLFHVSDGMRRQ